MFENHWSALWTLQHETCALQSDLWGSSGPGSFLPLSFSFPIDLGCGLGRLFSFSPANLKKCHYSLPKGHSHLFLSNELLQQTVTGPPGQGKASSSSVVPAHQQVPVPQRRVQWPDYCSSHQSFLLVCDFSYSPWPPQASEHIVGTHKFVLNE